MAIDPTTRLPVMTTDGDPIWQVRKNRITRELESFIKVLKQNGYLESEIQKAMHGILNKPWD